jgi:hypothetical protein
MEQQILDITFHILKKAKTNGYNSTTKESESLTQEISKLTVSVDKIGDDKVKAHIFSFTKKSRKDKSCWNLIMKNKNKVF